MSHSQDKYVSRKNQRAGDIYNPVLRGGGDVAKAAEEADCKALSEGKTIKIIMQSVWTETLVMSEIVGIGNFDAANNLSSFTILAGSIARPNTSVMHWTNFYLHPRLLSPGQIYMAFKIYWNKAIAFIFQPRTLSQFGYSRYQLPKEERRPWINAHSILFPPIEVPDNPQLAATAHKTIAAMKEVGIPIHEGCAIPPVRAKAMSPETFAIAKDAFRDDWQFLIRESSREKAADVVQVLVNSCLSLNGKQVTVDEQLGKFGSIAAAAVLPDVKKAWTDGGEIAASPEDFGMVLESDLGTEDPLSLYERFLTGETPPEPAVPIPVPSKPIAPVQKEYEKIWVYNPEAPGADKRSQVAREEAEELANRQIPRLKFCLGGKDANWLTIAEAEAAGLITLALLPPPPPTEELPPPLPSEDEESIAAPPAPVAAASIAPTVHLSPKQKAKELKRKARELEAQKQAPVSVPSPAPLAALDTVRVPTVTQWHRKDGEVVNEGDLIVTMDDAGSKDVRADSTGILHILVQPGETIVGPVANIEDLPPVELPAAPEDTTAMHVEVSPTLPSETPAPPPIPVMPVEFDSAEIARREAVKAEVAVEEADDEAAQLQAELQKMEALQAKLQAAKDKAAKLREEAQLAKEIAAEEAQKVAAAK